METALSTHFFVSHRLNTTWLEKVFQAGFPLVEIFCARQHFDYRNRSQIRELASWFRDSRLKLHSLHSPMYNDDCWGRTGPDAVVKLTEPIKWKRIAMVDEVKRALEVAEEIPFRYLVQHLGVTGEEFDGRLLDAAFTALEELSLFARQRGVNILLENTPNALATPERLHYFLETTHLDLYFCFDTGHAHMSGGVAKAFDAMKPRIRSTHIHDNDGKEDHHWMPLGQGTIPWRETMSLLNTAGAPWPLLLELKEDPALEQPFARARQTLDQLMNLK